MAASDSPTIHEMILAKVTENRKAIGDLGDKLDEKITDVHKRINPIERDVATIGVDAKGIAGRVRWCIWALSAIALAFLSAVVGAMVANGG